MKRWESAAGIVGKMLIIEDSTLCKGVPSKVTVKNGFNTIRGGAAGKSHIKIAAIETQNDGDQCVAKFGAAFLE
jgi:hypothetical protein